MGCCSNKNIVKTDFVDSDLINSISTPADLSTARGIY